MGTLELYGRYKRNENSSNTTRKGDIIPKDESGKAQIEIDVNVGIVRKYIGQHFYRMRELRGGKDSTRRNMAKWQRI